MTTTPTSGNPVNRGAGVEQRERIVELVAANIDAGGSGITRTELADEMGIAKKNIHKHLRVLFEEGRLEQIGMKVVPTGGHIHVCRICGKTMI